MPVTYYVALPFVRTEEGIAAGQGQECPSEVSAIRRADAMAREAANAGALAFNARRPEHRQLQRCNRPQDLRRYSRKSGRAVMAALPRHPQPTSIQRLVPIQTRHAALRWLLVGVPVVLPFFDESALREDLVDRLLGVRDLVGIKQRKDQHKLRTRATVRCRVDFQAAQITPAGL